MKVAIVHDWLDTWRGGEQVLAELFGLYPEAKLFTLVNFMGERELARLGSPKIRTSFIQRLPFARGSFRRYLPLFPAAIERFDLSRFDLVISSSHAVAKGVRTSSNQLHICYCYTPMRYAWTMQENYLEQTGLNVGIRGIFLRALLGRLRAWDYRVSSRVNHFVAISKYIAARIGQCYGRDAVVIYPPVAASKLMDIHRHIARSPYFVTVSGMVPYKRIDLIVAAFRDLPGYQLVVIGDGPERSKIEMLAGSNVRLLGQLSDLERDCYVAGARAFIFAAEEDFGIAPLEAQALGIPVIAYGRGGVLETLRGLDDPKPTAMFFSEQSASAIGDAVRRFDRVEAVFDADACRASAKRFEPGAFREAFGGYVADRYQEFGRQAGSPSVINRSLLRDHAPFFDRLLQVIDPLFVILTGLVAYRIYLGDWQVPERYVLALLGAGVLCAALFPFLGLYAPRRGVSWFDEIRRLVNAWMLLAAAWFTFLFLSKSGADFSRVWSTYWLVAGLGIHLAFRGTLRLLLYRLRQRGYNLRHIVIVGAGQLGQEIVQRLRKTTGSGFDIHGFYDDAPSLQGQQVCGLPVLGDTDQVLSDLENQPVDQVWVALPLRAEARIRDLLSGLRQHSVQVRFVPDIFNFALLRHSMTEIAGLPVINLTDSPLQGGNVLLKHTEDFLLSAVLLLLASPLMLVIAIGIKISSPGPVFYRQERITWNGERFSMLKFRSMPTGAEASSGPVWAHPEEERATRFGAWLRRWSIDEVPQFINVLKGEMSIVGPRPERPEFVERFKREVPGYMQKHLVKAGITGWAQVNDLRGNTDLGKRIQYDLYYIENWSVWFDLRIMALTIGHLFRSRNAY